MYTYTHTSITVHAALRLFSWWLPFHLLLPMLLFWLCCCCYFLRSVVWMQKSIKLSVCPYIARTSRTAIAECPTIRYPASMDLLACLKAQNDHSCKSACTWTFLDYIHFYSMGIGYRKIEAKHIPFFPLNFRTYPPYLPPIFLPLCPLTPYDKSVQVENAAPTFWVAKWTDVWCRWVLGWCCHIRKIFQCSSSSPSCTSWKSFINNSV